jgi:hypothetical protein
VADVLLEIHVALSDVESCVCAARFLCVDADVLDARSRRPAPDVALDARDGLGLPFNIGLDTAVRPVRHPPGDALPHRGVAHEVAEAHALDAASNDEPSSNAHGNGRDYTGRPVPDLKPKDILWLPSQWWHHLLHNQRALWIKGALLFRPNVVVTSVPFHLP